MKTIQYKAGLTTETHAGRELRYSQRKRTFTNNTCRRQNIRENSFRNIIVAFTALRDNYRHPNFLRFAEVALAWGRAWNRLNE